MNSKPAFGPYEMAIFQIAGSVAQTAATLALAAQIRNQDLSQGDAARQALDNFESALHKLGPWLRRAAEASNEASQES